MPGSITSGTAGGTSTLDSPGVETFAAPAAAPAAATAAAQATSASQNPETTFDLLRRPFLRLSCEAGWQDHLKVMVQRPSKAGVKLSLRRLLFSYGISTMGSRQPTWSGRLGSSLAQGGLLATGLLHNSSLLQHHILLCVLLRCARQQHLYGLLAVPAAPNSETM